MSKKEKDERAEEALEIQGIKERIENLPTEIYGKQKKQEVIARDVANETMIILDDEATGALDSKTSDQIIELFSMLHEEVTTIILVTHEDEVADYANRTIFIRDGVVTDENQKIKEEQP